MVSQIFTFFLLPALALCAPHVRHRHSTQATSASSEAAPALAVMPRDTASGVGGQIHFKNSCSYAVTVKPFPGTGCECGEGGEVAAGSSWNDTLKTCAGGNTSLKVYRVGETAPMQFEYGLANSMVWYDMSFIDCVASGYDFSACAGEGWSMGSSANCPTFNCTGGAECCKQGYCDPDATGVIPAPNAGCGPGQGYTDYSDLGITIELCPS